MAAPYTKVEDSSPLSTRLSVQHMTISPSSRRHSTQTVCCSAQRGSSRPLPESLSVSLVCVCVCVSSVRLRFRGHRRTPHPAVESVLAVIPRWISLVSAQPVSATDGRSTGECGGSAGLFRPMAAVGRIHRVLQLFRYTTQHRGGRTSRSLGVSHHRSVAFFARSLFFLLSLSLPPSLPLSVPFLFPPLLSPSA